MQMCFNAELHAKVQRDSALPSCACKIAGDVNDVAAVLQVRPANSVCKALMPELVCPDK